MQCIRPLKSSLDNKGERTYKQSEMMLGLIPVEFPCRKCLPCRLNIAREKAVRCYHESQMHDKSIFLTLTYAPEALASPKLQYLDFQLFMKRLREKVTRGITDPELKKQLTISYMVTGEYGEEKKRPHWHALLFNYYPDDAKLERKTDRGDLVFESKTIDDIWGYGKTEFGAVTIDSANYVARYAAKKLVHGKDHEHDFHPIHKTSSKKAIGRSWLEKYWKQTFNHGYVLLPNKQKTAIPRYYVDWLKKNHPEEFFKYASEVRPAIMSKAEARARKEELDWFSNLWSRPHGFKTPETRNQVKETILKSKFKQLQERLKL